ncbi:hypothetical protein AB4259_00830 [Vibrio amylolyticus]|uniref:hypothetical protein n=1 Tax=Vibrio TaxID=662 RepID=UPI000C83DA17|nr:hypothetical protein [Vibrio sp. 10N.261.55.A7]PMJ90635.1 hypothetical protein BCU12_11695 [Vibrio sp. 10N.261.55.A7]
MIKLKQNGQVNSRLQEVSKALYVPQGYVGFCFQPDKFPDNGRSALFTTGVGPCHCLIIVENESKSALLCHLDGDFTKDAVKHTTTLLKILSEGSGVKSPYFSVSLASSSPIADTKERAENVAAAVKAFCGTGTSGRIDAPVQAVEVAKTDHVFMIGKNLHVTGDVDQNKFVDKSSGAPGWADWQAIGGMSPGIGGRRIRHLLDLNTAPKRYIAAG